MQEVFISNMARIAEQMFGFHTASRGEGRSTSINDRPRNDSQRENSGANESSPEELMDNLARIAANFTVGGTAYRNIPRAERGNTRWKPEAGRSPVPHAPLTFGSTGDEVRFL